MFKKIFSSELGRGAIILFIMINLYNCLNFLFRFVMARILGPEDYGTLAVLMSIILILSIPIEAIQNLILKYTSRFNNEKNGKGKIKVMMTKSLKKGFKIAVWIFLLSLIVAFLLSKFLDISFWLIALTNLFIFSAFSIPITRGVLQGRKKFAAFGNNLITEAGLKLIFSISFVILGFRIFGAMAGVLMGMISAVIFSLYSNRDILNAKEKKTSFNGIYLQSITYFITMIVLFLTFNIDIILAKRFFSPDLVGKYAVLSDLGKMIFFATVAISRAMFPLTSEKHEHGKDSSKLFKKSLLIISSLCLIILLVYLLFPKEIVSVLYGNQYIEISNFLIYSGIALSFLSLTNLVLIYGLSTKGLKKPYYLFVFLIIEVILFFLFHKTIMEYIIAFMVSNIIMFICSFFFIKK